MTRVKLGVVAALTLAMSVNSTMAHAQGTPTLPPSQPPSSGASGTPTAPPPPTPWAPVERHTNKKYDVLHLRDGQTLRGAITEVRPGEGVALVLADGGTARVRWDDITAIDHHDAGKSALPEKLPYDPDTPIPPGYELVEKTRLGLLIPGAILTGIGLLLVGAGGYYAARGRGSGDFNGLAIVVGVGCLLPGIPLFIIGLVSKKKELVRDQARLTNGGATWMLPTTIQF